MRRPIEAGRRCYIVSRKVAKTQRLQVNQRIRKRWQRTKFGSAPSLLGFPPGQWVYSIGTKLYYHLCALAPLREFLLAFTV